MLENELNIAMKAAREAGKIIMQYYANGVEVEYKQGNEHVTAADRESDTTILEILKKEFPDDGYLTEESEDNLERLAKERVWIIDPLDGTEDFTLHTDQFAVHIGLAIDGQPVLGVVYAPVTDTMYSAIKGQGAYANRIPLQVSACTALEQATLVNSRKTARESVGKYIVDHLKVKSKVISGSCGLKMIGIADSSLNYDLFFHENGRCKEWDTCAPQVILEEAGGKITDIDGNQITYNKRDVYNRNGLLATNSSIHEEALLLIRQLRSSYQE